MVNLEQQIALIREYRHELEIHLDHDSCKKVSTLKAIEDNLIKVYSGLEISKESKYWLQRLKDYTGALTEDQRNKIDSFAEYQVWKKENLDTNENNQILD